mgnify:CR=1 FL=1
MIDEKARERWLDGLCLENLEKVRTILKKDLKNIEKKIKERLKNEKKNIRKI